MTSSFLTVILLTVLLVLPTCFVEAAKGLDASILLYSFDFKDFVEGGSGDFVILQGYRSNGSVNHNAVIDNEEAYGAGYDNFDVYMSPCPRCNKSAPQQVQEMVKGLENMTTGYGHIWLEVNDTKNWYLSQTTNRNFFKELLSEANKHKPTGVYTTEVEWRKIMGKSTIGSAYPLWYVHNDSNPSFNDFKPFGGWTQPQIKQYYCQVYRVKSLPQDVPIKQIWLEVQYPGNWRGNYTSNQKYFEELVSAASKHKQTGVLTNETQWEKIMGNSYTGGSSYPLWYILYDDQPTFDSFMPFGGWNKPKMKQYTQNPKDCVGNLNLDYSTP